MTLITACCLHAVFGQTQEEKNVLDEKAAPWWEQQEEAAKRQCQSSCTKYSKGVKPTVNLCDDTDVSQKVPILKIHILIVLYYLYP